MTQNTVFAITRQPETNQTVSECQTVILQVVAKGAAKYLYQWQYYNNGIWMSFPNENNDIISHKVFASQNYPIRCKVEAYTTGVWNSLYTDEITFTIHCALKDS